MSPSLCKFALTTHVLLRSAGSACAGEIRDNVLAALISFMYTQTLDPRGALSQRHHIVGLRDPSPVLHSGLAVLALTREHNVVYV